MNDNVFGCPPNDPKILAKYGVIISPAPGSIDGFCDSCKCGITIGPRIQAKHKGEGGRLLCYPCLFKEHPNVLNEVKPLGKGGHDYAGIGKTPA